MVTQGSDIKMVFNIADTNNGVYDLEDAVVLVKIIKPSEEIDEIYCTITNKEEAIEEVEYRRNYVLNHRFKFKTKEELDEYLKGEDSIEKV